EVAVIAHASAELAQSTVRGRLAWAEFSPDELHAFSYRKDDLATTPPAVHLMRALADDEPPTIWAVGRGQLPAGSHLRLIRSTGPVDLSLPGSLQGQEKWEAQISLPPEIDL